MGLEVARSTPRNTAPAGAWTDTGQCKGGPCRGCGLATSGDWLMQGHEGPALSTNDNELTEPTEHEVCVAWRILEGPAVGNHAGAGGVYGKS